MGHKQQMIDAKPLRDLTRLHNLTVAEICTRAGVSPSAVHQWMRDGKMPAYMGPTCLGIVASLKGEVVSTSRPVTKPAELGARASGTEPSLASEILEVRVPADQREKLEGFLQGIGAKFRPREEF